METLRENIVKLYRVLPMAEFWDALEALLDGKSREVKLKMADVVRDLMAKEPKEG